MGGCYPLEAGSGIALASALSGLGYVIGTLMLYSPGASQSTRGAGAAMRDYAFVSLVFAAASGGVMALLDQIISSVVPASTDCVLLESFYRTSIEKAAVLLGAIGGIAAALPLIPVVGVALSLAWSVAMAPAVIALGAIILPLSVFQYVILLAFRFAGPHMFTAGVAAIAAPNRILKGLGGVLLAFSIVFYAALPIIPWAMGTILGGEKPEEIVDALVRMADPSNVASDVFSVILVPVFYDNLVKWVMLVFVGMVLIAIAIAAARGLSHSLGGVSASV